MADDASLRFNWYKGVDTASPHMGVVANRSTAMAAQVSASSALMQSRMLLLGGAIVVASSEVIAFTDAIAPMGGLLAAIPAVAFAGAASIGALAIGFHGLAAALKSSAAGAGPSASAIASAERRVAAAQREATQAQEGINKAREEAVRKLADLSQQLQLANLDEEESALQVKQAQIELTKARRSGDPTQLAQAQISLQRAQINLAQSQLHLSDTQAEYNDAQQKGIEGSDQVQSALQKQTDATQNLKDAQDALAQTKSGGGGADASAAAYAKLAPAAKQVVDALKSLGPVWRQVQQATQQALFQGLGGDLRNVGAAQLGGLKTGLAGVASGFNTAFRQTTQLASTPGFVRDTNTALANTTTFARLAGAAMAPLVDGLRQLGVVGSAYLPRLGAFIRDIAVGFQRWATNARESGRASQWISNGIVTAQKFWVMLVNVGTALRNIFHAGDAGPQFLDLLVKGSAAFAAWTGSVQGQAQLHEFFTSLRNVAHEVWEIFKGLAAAFTQAGPGISTIGALFSIAGVAVKLLADNMDLLRPLLPWLIGGFVAWKIAMTNATIAVKAVKLANDLFGLSLRATPIGLILTGLTLLVGGFILLWNKSEAFRNFWIGLWNGITSTAKAAWAILQTAVINPIKNFFEHPGSNIANIWETAVWGPIKAGGKAAVNALIWLVNQGIGFINSTIIDNYNNIPLLPDIARIPTIPSLATGGIVKARTGGTITRLGEGGEDEYVIPKSRLGGGRTQEAVVRFDTRGGGDAQVIDLLIKLISKGVGDRGGNVQFVLGGSR